MLPYHEHLIFWPFFEKIEKELSYERWIDKYKIFHTYLSSQAFDADSGSDPDEAFKVLCRVLFLQDNRDRKKFDEILDACWEDEKRLWRSWIPQSMPYSPPAPRPTRPETPSPPAPVPEPQKPSPGDVEPPRSKGGEGSTEKPTRFFNPQFEKVFDVKNYGSTAGVVDLDRKVFLHSDEFLPYTRRQMVKAWQRLRRKEKVGVSGELDIAAAIRNITKNGFLTETTFEPSYANRADTLLIYADVQGSMAPFSFLTERLVATAHGEGGHKKAGAYYFRNVPVSQVFHDDGLVRSMALKESLLHASQQYTVAVIISDAGAARGNRDETVTQARFELTKKFIKILQERTHKIFWLNPMPQHRWAGTCAERIVKAGNLVTMMAPVFENDAIDPQELIKKIIRH